MTGLPELRIPFTPFAVFPKDMVKKGQWGTVPDAPLFTGMDQGPQPILALKGFLVTVNA